MGAHPIRPALRLVGTGEAAGPRPLPGGDTAHERAARRIAAENRSASRLSAVDARWILAVEVAGALQGGRAAVLPPERRRQLVATARRMGLRDFDAGLVIAVVQDGARCGDDPLGADVAGRLELIRSPAADSPLAPDWQTIAASGLAGLLLAMVILWGMIRWVTG